MRLLAFLIIFIATSLTQALEVSKKGDRIVLKDTCANGPESLKALSSWLNKSQPTKSCRTQSKSQGTNCLYDITDCLPEQVVRYQGVNPKIVGPNCWNLALVMGKILPNLRYSSPAEMGFYMRPPLCRQLKDNERREPGDIGAIRDVYLGITTDEAHGFVYVSDEMVFSKNGTRKENPYALQSLNKMLDMYGVDQQSTCRKNEISRGSSECSRAVAYFRCDSMDDYLKKNPNLSPHVKKLEDEVASTERCIEATAFSGTALNESNLRDIQQVSGALTHYLADMKKSNALDKMSEEDRFMIGGLQLRLGAIAEQLSALKSTTINSKSKETASLSRAFSEAIRTLDTNASANNDDDDEE